MQQKLENSAKEHKNFQIEIQQTLNKKQCLIDSQKLEFENQLKLQKEELDNQILSKNEIE